MKKRALAPLLAVTLALLAGCAAPAPPAARPAPPPQAELETKPPAPAAPEAPEVKVSLLCDPAVRRIAFPSIGIPLHTRILDIALTPDRVWLLVDQHHIVEVGRSPEQATFRMITGKEDATWDALDVDPRDGSLWIVSLLRLELIHLIPDGKSTVVRLSGVEGEGGFRDVLVDEEGVYVVPTCAEDALWRVDRGGKVLERAFHREGEEPLTLRTEFTPEEGQGSVFGCQPVSLARDLSGRITAFDGVTRTFYRHDSADWAPLLEIPDPELPAGGVRVDNPGTEQATWAPGWGASGNALGFFFLGEEPVFQPEMDIEKSKSQTVIKYLRPGTEGLTQAFERCKPSSWFAPPLVVSDRHGYVSSLDNQLILGTFGGTN